MDIESSESYSPPIVVENEIFFHCNINANTSLTLIKQLKEVENSLIAAYQKNHSDQRFITLHINSPGGTLYAALAVYGVIQSLKVPIVIVIEGIACSAASLIAMAGTRRLIHKDSFMLIHQLTSGTRGKMTELEGEIINLREFSRTIKNIYLRHTAFPENELDNVLRQDIFLNADTCKKNGLVDEIIEHKPLYELNTSLV